MDIQTYKDLADQHVMPNYGKRSIALVRGSGSYVWDSEGRKYLDFLAGISVNNLGHCPPRVVEAVRHQAGEFMHCSNLYLVPNQLELARRLCELCFADRAFFANSGAEVNEGAIKLARLYSKTKFGENRHEIITVRNSFHGRTLGTLAATGQDKIQKGFEPLPVGFRYAEFNNLQSVQDQLTEAVCAIMVEPVQGEGGVTAASPEFLKGLRELCDRKNLLLIFDEIQCGMGRCGKMFAHQVYGIEPDIMTLAKALGNGIPIGALLARGEVADVLVPGTHGSTFGGGPIACAAGLAVLDEMKEAGIVEKVSETAKYLRDKLESALKDLPVFVGLKGLGLMLGVELSCPGANIVRQCQEKGMLINCTMGNILRLLPPLNVSQAECDQAVEILASVLKDQPSESPSS